MNQTNFEESSREPEAPVALAEALRARFAPSGTRGSVPDGVDLAVLEAARGEIRRQAAARRTRWIGGGIGLAASIGIVAAVVMMTGRTPSGRQSLRTAEVAALPERDVDGNGRLDMLDAFALARSLRAGESPGVRFDINLDGLVDSQDVDLLAMASVQLSGGGHLQ